MPIRFSISSRPYLLVASLLISGCAITGPADDGWENSNEWVDNGRLLSDESKTVYSSKDSKKAGTSRGEGLDYDAYRQWQEAKESNSPEYQKFKQWQEFEAFDRWKAQQKPE